MKFVCPPFALFQGKPIHSSVTRSIGCWHPSEMNPFETVLGPEGSVYPKVNSLLDAYYIPRPR